jgi:hypothetical protein
VLPRYLPRSKSDVPSPPQCSGAPEARGQERPRGDAVSAEEQPEVPNPAALTSIRIERATMRKIIPA